MMKRKIVATLVFLCLALSSSFAQQSTKASRQDVLKLLEVLQVRKQTEVMLTAAMQQAKQMTAEEFKRSNPNATAEEIEAATISLSSFYKEMPREELIEATIPIYQRHFTHNEIQAMINFYSTGAGQKFVREMPAVSVESMQAANAVLQKHLPELMEKAEQAAREAAAKPSETKQPPKQ